MSPQEPGEVEELVTKAKSLAGVPSQDLPCVVSTP